MQHIKEINAVYRRGTHGKSSARITKLGVKKNMTEGELRDQLAVQRTHLANERTLLAYVRTALAAAAGGAVLLQFFPAYSSLLWLAWLLIASGGVMLVIGTYRFLAVRRHLNEP